MPAAIRTILIADLVMSLDNVIAVAAASRGDTLLLVLGLLISIPLVVYGSTLLLKLIERFPAIVWGGAALLDTSPGTSRCTTRDRGVGDRAGALARHGARHARPPGRARRRGARAAIGRFSMRRRTPTSH
jgi:hypothetical protein